MHKCGIYIDRYMLRGVWQALNCLSISAAYCMIIAAVSPGETKMWAAARENGDFLTVVNYFITVVNYTIFAAIIDSFMLLCATLSRKSPRFHLHLSRSILALRLALLAVRLYAVVVPVVVNYDP